MRSVSVVAIALSLVLVGQSLAADSASDRQLPLLRTPAELQTKWGAQFMKYLVSCALPEGVKVRLPAAPEGRTQVLSGSMGLAPAWRERAITPEEQRSVSACLLARINAFGVPVVLSMRRDGLDEPESLRAGKDERARFPRLEGAFFGNLFVDSPVAYFCRGDDQPGRAAWLQHLKRICTLPTDKAEGASACGFLDAGLCANAAWVQDGIDYRNSAIQVFLPADEPAPIEGD